MASAYPAATTYSSPAFATSPKAAHITAPAAAKGRFWQGKKHTGPAPLAAGAAAAAATSNNTHSTANSNMKSTPTAAQRQSPTGPLEAAAASQAAANGATGAFPQSHGQHRAVEGSRAGQEQPRHAVTEPMSEVDGVRPTGYSREAEMGPVGPQGVNGAFEQSNGGMQSAGQRQNGNKAGFFQSS